MTLASIIESAPIAGVRAFAGDFWDPAEAEGEPFEAVDDETARAFAAGIIRDGIADGIIEPEAVAGLFGVGDVCDNGDRALDEHRDRD